MADVSPRGRRLTPNKAEDASDGASDAAGGCDAMLAIRLSRRALIRALTGHERSPRARARPAI